MSNEINATVSPGNEVVTWQDKMKQYAVAAVESEQPQGQFFSIKAGVLSFGGVPIPNNLMDVIVAGSLHENVYYEGRYDAQQPSGPVCYAFSDTGVDMRPHEDSPKQQNVDCKTCPRNKWGSDPQGGKGKACKNVRRLCLISASALNGPVAGIGSAVAGYLRVPVTSVAAYQRFISQVGARGLPPFAVVARVKVVPDPKTQVKVEFELVKTISDNAQLQALMERFEVESKLIDFPYPTDNEEAPKTTTPPTTPPPPPQQPASKF